MVNKTNKRAFKVLWAGQSISLLGTGMTRFAVLLWAYQQEGTATALALLGFFVTTAFVVASPFAGVLVDRWDRRKVMAFADLGAGCMTALLLVLYTAGRLQVWHLYLAQGVAGALEAFQDPAFSASVSLLVPRERYTRANSLLGLGRSASRIFAPALASVLMQTGGLEWVMAVDLGTLALALIGLLCIRIPAPPRSVEGAWAMGHLGRELRFGFQYIFRRPGLRGVLLIFFLINVFATLTYFGVLSPMILARTGGDEVGLGVVRAVMGVGGVVGGMALSLWGGPRRKVRLYLLSTSLSFLICDFLMGVSRSVAGWSIAGFLSDFGIPFIISPYYALWQELVPPDVQGRVFATREMVQVTAQPFGYLAAGFLADRVFEPAMQVGGALAGSLGWLVGTGPGAGMAAMFICTSLGGVLIGLLGWLSPAIRKLDTP